VLQLRGTREAKRAGSAPALLDAGIDPGAPRIPRSRGGVTSLRTFDALHDRSFRWFFVSMLSQFSSMHMQMVVTPWLVYELTGSYARLGAIALASAVPGLILGFGGGVIADRAPKKLVVQVGQTLNAVSTLAIAILLSFGLLEFSHLMIAAAAQGAVFAIMGPARQALIPEIVGPRRLTNAIALNMAGLNVTRMGVPALGGFLIAIIGAAGVYYLMAALIFIAMVGLTPVRRHEAIEGDIAPDGYPAAPAPHAMPDAPRNPRTLRGGLRDVVDGMRYVAADRTVGILLLVNFFIVLMSMPYMQMMAGFVSDVLDGGEIELGILNSVAGIGSLVGSLAIASMPSKDRGRWYLLSALTLGVALVAFSASQWLWLTAVIMVVVGAGQAGRMSLSNVLLMAYTQPSYQGRVMSVYMMEFSLVSFGTFLVGIAAEFVGIQVAIGATAVSLIVISAAGLLLVPKVRDLP
jgi:MFS family permease